MRPTMPVRLDRLEASIYDACVFATGVAPLWAYQHNPYDDDSSPELLSARLIDGPRARIRSHPFKRNLRPADSVTYTLVPQTDARQIININGHRFAVDTDGTPNLARDALLEQLSRFEGESFTVAESGDDTLVATPSFFGGIWRSSIHGAGVSAVAAVTTTDLVGVTERQVLLTVVVETFSRSATPADNAMQRASQLVAAMRSPGGAEVMRLHSIAIVNVGNPTDLSRLKNARWETRAVVPIVLSMVETFVTEAFPSIATLDFSVEMQEPELIASSVGD